MATELEMDRERRMLILKMIVLAAEEIEKRRSPDFMLTTSVKQYGARYEIASSEVETVLAMPVHEVVSHRTS